MPNVIEEIAAERRQIEVEGFTSAHDGEHRYGELLAAGVCYIKWSGYRLMEPPEGWPWRRMWWKPKDCRSDLIRGVALLVAEIERLDRLTAPKEPKP